MTNMKWNKTKVYVEIVRVKPWDGAISKIREAEYDFSQIQPHIFMNVPHP